MKRTAFFVTLAMASATTLASAGEVNPYSEQAFAQLTHADKAVVLDVSAPWCPTCKVQKPIIDELMKQPAYKDVTLLTIDFDTSKPTLRKFNVAMQSTLVAFKGEKEVGRSVGDTHPASLEALIKKTVK